MQKRFRPPYKLLVVVVILLAIGFLILPAATKAPDKITAMTVLISGIPFLFVFVAILLTYISLIIIIQRYYSGYMPEKRFNWLFFTCMGGIVIGILFMFQPFRQPLYPLGFLILLFSLLSFIAVSHITPRRKIAEEQE